MIPIKLRKAFHCAVRPSLWRALARRVAPSIEHHEALAHLRFDTIVDVGANRGQFALFARRINPDARIVAFEPLASARAMFEQLLGADPKIRCHAVAVGASHHDATMFVTAKDDSSSLLPIAEAQRKIFGTVTRSTQSVVVRRLSEVIPIEDIRTPSLLKIDAEGAELDVLSGAEELLHLFAAIYVECSYIALCEKQPLVQHVIAWLQTRGFVVGGVYNQVHHPGFGPVQADFLFVRSETELTSRRHGAPPAGCRLAGYE